MYNENDFSNQVNEAVNSADNAFFIWSQIAGHEELVGNIELMTIATILHDALLLLEDAQSRLNLRQRSDTLSEYKTP